IFGDRFHYLALLALLVAKARDPANPAPELSLVPLVSFLPAILFGPLAGPLVDRWNVKRVLVASDAVRAALVLVLIPAATWGGLPAAFGLVFALYIANTFFLPARSAILPLIVPPERLVAANSLATLAGVLATLAGSLIGGWVVERVGWRWGFAMDAATYFVSVGVLATIPLSAERTRASAVPPVGRGEADALPPPGLPYRELARSLLEGVRTAARSAHALGSIAALVLLWAAGGILHVAGTLLVKERMSGVVEGVGSLLASAALGMILGTTVLSALGNAVRGAAVAVGSLAGAGVALVAFALARPAGALYPIAFATGISVAALLIVTEAALQRAVPSGARGRVFALRDLAGRVAVLASAASAGVLVGRGVVSPAAAVAGAGALLIAGGLVGALAGASVRAAARAARRE
ncbi:MAG TPA: MFS transporter, partial [Candidatus Eisenbacteria bacterium]